MPVYVDNAKILHRGSPRNHMSADSLAELHAFAAEIGVKKCWYHRGTAHPHYDITDIQREQALNSGATAVDSRFLLKIAKRLAAPTIP